VRLDEAALAAWGEAVGRAATRPAFFALRGDLGAGKSVLARAIARGAGVRGAMPSPTFNLLYRYPAAGGDVVHLDLYRLDRADEVWELGWRELPAAGEVVLVEWPERAQTLLPSDRWDITLDAVAGAPELRDVSIAARGAAGPLPAPAGRVGAGTSAGRAG
jgi:tRNA threonylcarbamoyl adenosine modification protein YjeE